MRLFYLFSAVLMIYSVVLLNHLFSPKESFLMLLLFYTVKLTEISMSQFSSIAQSCPTLCDPMGYSTKASLFITISQSLLKLMSIKSVMPSNHFILCHPLLLLPSIFPSIRVFSNESVLHIGSQSIGTSASTSVLSMNIQD